MKGTLILLIGLAAFAAHAQSTNAPAAVPEPPFPNQAALRLGENPLQRKEVKPNEIAAGHLTLSGIAVEAAEVPTPLQLINPAAPRRYGLARDNVVFDPVTGRASGLKFFSIQF